MNKPRRIVLSLAVAAAAIVPPAVALAAPPGNDDFSASDLAAFAPGGGTFVGTNVDATPESSEPDHATSGFGALHSIWYSWTPQVGGTAHLHTCDSAFNTRLAVYTGNSVDALTLVADNEDSVGPTCAGTAWAELSFGVTPGTTYRIAVDTSGGVTPAGVADNNNPPQGTARVVLEAPTGTPEEPPADDKTNPGTVKTPRLVPNFRIPRLIASCGDDTPRGNEQCKQGPFEFKTATNVNVFIRKLEQRGIPVVLKDTSAVASSKAKTPGQQQALRAGGSGGEITFADIELEFPGGDDTTLDQGGRYDISTDETVTIRYSFFDLAKDKGAIANDKQQLQKEAERLAEARNNAPKSKCLPIAAGESNQQIVDRFPPSASGFRSYLDMFDGLAKLGCQVEISKYVRGKASAPRSYVKEVSGRDAGRDTISVVLAQPGAHDFVFAIRENPAEFTSQANRSNIPIGTDGQLTASKKQLNRLTVQVIEQSTGRLVAGIPVSFVGKDGGTVVQNTDGSGETTFVSKLNQPGDYRLSASYKEMEGWRTIRAEDRGKKAFTSMAGRKIVLSSKGLYAGSDEAQLEFAKSLPVVPANLGTGNAGAVESVARIQQSTVTTFDNSGREVTGQHNVVALPPNSNILVGAGSGLLAIGGGQPAQAGRRAARLGVPNPLEFLAGIVGPMKSAIDSGAANIRSALGGAQASIAAIAQQLNAPPSNLISDKGLGVISTGGGNLIGQAGGNLISDKGLGVISVGGGNLIGQAGGNLIGQAGGNLIGQAGGNVISNDGCSCTPTYGGRVIATGGGN